MTPAPLSRRFLAGLIDFAIVTVLSVMAFVAPMLTRGFVVPMWGVLIVLVGYAVVPVAFLKQTPGLRFVGAEVVKPDGHPVDLGNVLFRELLGRGLFPLAFLYTVLFGMLGALLRISSFAMPVGVGSVMFFASFIAVLVAIAGHFLAFSRPDGRTLADLMAGSVVVVAPSRPPPEDPDERADARAARASTVRNIIVFEVLAGLSVIALPWLLTSRAPGETSEQRIHRITREKLTTRFEADPGNRSLADQLERAALEENLPDEARRIAERHEAALRRGEEHKEAALREQLRGRPGDEALAAELVQLLERQGRVADAQAVYRVFVDADPTPKRRTGFAHWLASVDQNAEAEREMRAALEQDPLVPFGRTILGVTLERERRLEEARDELFLAVQADPSDEDALDALGRVTAALGPLSKEREAELTRRLEGWRGDGGE